MQVNIDSFFKPFSRFLCMGHSCGGREEVTLSNIKSGRVTWDSAQSKNYNASVLGVYREGVRAATGFNYLLRINEKSNKSASGSLGSVEDLYRCALREKSYVDVQLTDIAKAGFQILNKIIERRLIVRSVQKNVFTLKDCVDPGFSSVSVAFTEHEKAFVCEFLQAFDRSFITFFERQFGLDGASEERSFYPFKENPLSTVLFRPLLFSPSFLHEDDPVSLVLTGVVPINSSSPTVVVPRQERHKFSTTVMPKLGDCDRSAATRVLALNDPDDLGRVQLDYGNPAVRSLRVLNCSGAQSFDAEMEGAVHSTPFEKGMKSSVLLHNVYELVCNAALSHTNRAVAGNQSDSGKFRIAYVGRIQSYEQYHACASGKAPLGKG